MRQDLPEMNATRKQTNRRELVIAVDACHDKRFTIGLSLWPS